MLREKEQTGKVGKRNEGYIVATLTQEEATYPRTALKGHPSRAPRAMAKMASCKGEYLNSRREVVEWGLTHSRLCSQLPMATITQYIAKELGKKAVDATNIPQLGTRKRSVHKATGWPKRCFTALFVCGRLSTV